MHQTYKTGKPYQTIVGLYGADCDQATYDSLPDLTMQIGDTFYTISKHQYIIFKEDFCVVQIAPSQDGYGGFLGINWFENYYTIFDVENKRVGFAESVYSQLTPYQSAKHNDAILMNLNTIEMMDHFTEINSVPYGTEMLIAGIALLSTILGSILAKFYV